MKNDLGSGGRGLFQFSLTGVFVIITATALVLSLYFGVGRWIGMSTSEVLTQGLGRFLFRFPTLLVWTAGLYMAIRYLKRNRLPAMLTIIALAAMMTSALILELVQMALIYWGTSGQVSGQTMSWSFGVIGIVNAVINASCWICILTAIFTQRPSDEKVAVAETPEEPDA